MKQKTETKPNLQSLITPHALVHAHMHMDMYTQIEEQTHIDIYIHIKTMCMHAHGHTHACKHYAHIHVLRVYESGNKHTYSCATQIK